MATKKLALVFAAIGLVTCHNAEWKNDHKDSHQTQEHKHEKLDPLCHQFHEGKCVECATRAYFGHDHRCVNVNPLCKTYDKHDGGCRSCYDGYELKKDLCVIDPDWKQWHHHESVDHNHHHQKSKEQTKKNDDHSHWKKNKKWIREHSQKQTGNN